MNSTNKTTSSSKDQILSVLKEWIAPTLISIVGMLVWRDINELRADVKILLLNQSASAVEIQSLKSDVASLKAVVFKSEFEYNKSDDAKSKRIKSKDE